MPGIRSLGALIIFLSASFIGLSSKIIIILTFLIFLFLFIVVPTLFHFSGFIQKQMIFLTWVKWPKHVDFNRPQSQGINGTINYYISSEKGVEIGVWQALPKKLILKGEGKSKSWHLNTLSYGNPIIIYMHGNTGARSRDHRVQMYKVLQELNYHVIAFDYRGYADSTRIVPNKIGVVKDGHVIYQHVQKYSGNSPIFIWGHSLGTGVSSQVVSDLSIQGNTPNGLILESPFNNVRDEIKLHPFTYLWRKMPWFEWFFTEPLSKGEVAFFTDQVIKNIHIPIMILHARDDLVVPYVLCKKLYKAAMSSRNESSKPIYLITFKKENRFGHVNIHESPNLPELVVSFIQKSIQNNWTKDDYKRNLEF